MTRGEKGAAFWDHATRRWEPVTVLRGLAETSSRKLVFGRNGPEWRGRPSYLPLCEFRRQRDGQRFVLDRDGDFVAVPG